MSNTAARGLRTFKIRAGALQSQGAAGPSLWVGEPLGGEEWWVGRGRPGIPVWKEAQLSTQGGVGAGERPSV